MKTRRSMSLIAAVALAVTACGGATTATPPAAPAATQAPAPTTAPTAAPTVAPPTATPAPTPAPTATPPAAPQGPLGDGRQIQTATVLADGGILVAGGYAPGDGALSSATRYDPGTDVFSPTGSMADARGSHTATRLGDGRILIAGGGPASWTGAAVTFLAAAELYDPAAGTFSPAGSMSTPREHHTATRLKDGRVLIVGGMDTVDHAVASAELYDPKAGTFGPTGPMDVTRAFHTATPLPDGRVLIAGGNAGTWSYDGPFLDSAEIYDPKTGTFTTTGSMTTPRGWHTATRLADGRVLIAGGENKRTDLTSAEIYNPKTGKFTKTGSLTVGRVYHAAVRLSDGRVLVTGGGNDYSGGKFLTSAELYDPKTGTWTETGSMADQRNLMTSTLLADGRVLVAGGFGATGPLAVAELYDPKTGTFSLAGAGG